MRPFALPLRKVLLGLGAGFSAGYLIARGVEAIAELRDPAPPRPRDAAAYARTRRALQVAGAIRGTAGIAAFAYASFSERLDRATSGAPVWLRPACLVAWMSIASAALELPVDFVEDHTLERRYGLSEQSRAAWLLDYAKGAAISTLISAIVSMLFGSAVRRAPRTWPILAGLGALPLFVIGNVVVPLFVMPLFNTFEPVTGSLERRLRALASRYGVGDAEILRMDMSRQTRKANAFVTGIGRTHRIVLGDTLLASFPENETEFVVAHELGHYVGKDTWRLIAVGEALALALFVIANATTPARERSDLRDRPLLVIRLYATMLAATQALRPLLFAFSRSREWAADRFALRATNDAAGGAAAFRRLREQNLADDDPPAWYEWLFASHPSLKARIAALENAS